VDSLWIGHWTDAAALRHGTWMENVIWALAELLFAKTARAFLRLFGVRSVPEWIAILLGLVLWVAISIFVVALLRR
jgi:hypothetical protein